MVNPDPVRAYYLKTLPINMSIGRFFGFLGF
jgi:hypothetical protein